VCSRKRECHSTSLTSRHGSATSGVFRGARDRRLWSCDLTTSYLQQTVGDIMLRGQVCKWTQISLHLVALLLHLMSTCHLISYTPMIECTRQSSSTLSQTASPSILGIPVLQVCGFTVLATGNWTQHGLTAGQQHVHQPNYLATRHRRGSDVVRDISASLTPTR
jgi:hypothetical protein